MLGPGRAAQSYLDVERVVQAAVQARCTALHPGWGFLSENPLLATLCAQHGVTFIGPPPHVTALMGSKTRAKAAMRAAGLAGHSRQRRRARRRRRRASASRPTIGFPVLFKAENGGGGRGMRIARARRRGRAALRRGAGRGARRVRRRSRVPREADRGRPPRRDPGVRRSLRPRRAPRRARLHGAAQPPEADRGEPVAGAHRPISARASARPRRARPRASATSARARWRCCSIRRRAAVHGDELPAPGRAHGQRGAHRQGPRDRAARDRRRAPLPWTAARHRARPAT